MRATKRCWPAVVAAGALAASGARAADTVYAHDYSAAKRVVAYPVGLPTSQTTVGAQSGTFVGMDFDRAGTTLWAIHLATQTLGTISLANGSFAPVVAIQGVCCTTAFAIDPVSGDFLVSRDDQFVHRLDPITGATAILAAGVPAGNSISALTINCNRVVVAATGTLGNTALYRTDLQGSPTLIGMPNASTATALDFDNPTGKLYGWFNASGAESSLHGEVSLVDAQLSNPASVAGRYRMASDNVCTTAQLRLFANGFEG